NRFVQRVIQAKLEVSRPGDQYEQEADQVARRIISMPAAGAQPLAHRAAVPVHAIPVPRTQYQVPLEEEQRKASQAKAFHATAHEAPNGVLPHAEELVSAASSPTGQPLPANLHRKFEQALGADLSAVRVHTGSQSVEASKAMNARAYTIGNDIHFNQ